MTLDLVVTVWDFSEDYTLGNERINAEGLSVLPGIRPLKDTLLALIRLGGDQTEHRKSEAHP